MSRPDWIDSLLTGDRRSLARAITAVENETAASSAVLSAIHPKLGRALVVGVTGAPGAGKSTLVNAYVTELRKRGKTVGVVAVDPSSPISGGAILGDRIRMSDHAGDPGVFVRSLASRGHLGGLSRTAARVVDVMDAAGRDVVVVETVGTGQSEVEIAELAHTKLVVSAPGMGDDIQAVKAGILEIADVLVVNKADLPLAPVTISQLSEMVKIFRRAGWTPPVVATTATTGEGIAELADRIEEHAAATADARPAAEARARRLIATLAAQRLKDILAEDADERLSGLVEQVQKGEVGFDAAAVEALRLCGMTMGD